MNRVVHFEIQAEDIERAKKFYEGVFGWEIKKWDGMMDYYMVLTAPMGSKEPGISGGMLKRPCKTPPTEFGTNAYTCTIDVQNFDEMSEKVLKAGGKIALPKGPIPGMAWIGYFLDTEGNTFGLFQEDKNAK